MLIFNKTLFNLKGHTVSNKIKEPWFKEQIETLRIISFCLELLKVQYFEKKLKDSYENNKILNIWKYKSR